MFSDSGCWDAVSLFSSFSLSLVFSLSFVDSSGGDVFFAVSGFVLGLGIFSSCPMWSFVGSVILLKFISSSGVKPNFLAIVAGMSPGCTLYMITSISLEGSLVFSMMLWVSEGGAGV